MVQITPHPLFKVLDDDRPCELADVKRLSIAMGLKAANIYWYITFGSSTVKPYAVKEGPGKGKVIRDPLYGVLLRNMAAGNVNLNCVPVQPNTNPIDLLDTLNKTGIYVPRGALGKMLGRSSHRENAWRYAQDWERQPPYGILARTCDLIITMVKRDGTDGLYAWLEAANTEYRARDLPEMELRPRHPTDNLESKFKWVLE